MNTNEFYVTLIEPVNIPSLVGWGTELLLGLVLVALFIRNLWRLGRMDPGAPDFARRAAEVTVALAWVRVLGILAFGVALLLSLLGIHETGSAIPESKGEIGTVLMLLVSYHLTAYFLICGIILWVFALFQVSIFDLLLKRKEARAAH